TTGRDYAPEPEIPPEVQARREAAKGVSYPEEFRRGVIRGHQNLLTSTVATTANLLDIFGDPSIRTELEGAGAVPGEGRKPEERSAYDVAQILATSVPNPHKDILKAILLAGQQAGAIPSAADLRRVALRRQAATEADESIQESVPLEDALYSAARGDFAPLSKFAVSKSAENVEQIAASLL
ncbi:hypothetical protein RZS08_15475, partial [Arthrospira platensis SPKY1]|nr:hypothetical protein [Arthrospira platensis SPKY1]